METTVALPNVSQPTQLEMLALRRVISDAIDKEVGKALNQGTHEVDVTVRIMGTVKKGAPYEQTCPLSVPWQTAFMLAVSRLNKQTGESVEKLIDSLMTETDEGLKRDPEAIKKTEEQIKPYVEEVCQRLIGKTKQIMSGRITCRLSPVVLTRNNGTVQGHVTQVVKAAPVESETNSGNT